MNRSLYSILCVVLIVGIAGCIGIGGSTANPGVDEGTDLDSSIAVNTAGESAAEPDTATLLVAVTATGPTADAVRDDLAVGDEALRSALIEWGLDADAVRTDRYDVRETRTSRDHPDRESYEGVHRFAVEIDDVDAVGEVIDVTVDAGADEIQRIRFGLSDDRERAVRDEAIATAMANADADAAAIAAASDLDVTGVRTASIGGARVTPYTETDVAMREDADAGAGTPPTGIEVGDVHVRVSVTVVYDVRPS